jgi:predicted phosphoribosyltransferase
MFMPSNQQTTSVRPRRRPHNEWTFRNRESAGLMLAERLKARSLDRPLVLAIPRGGVVLGAVLARELGAELDVALVRKLRAPGNPECAVGAISETGQVYLNLASDDDLLEHEGYLAKEREHQLSELNWRKEIYRSVRPQASIAGRSVILTDDGIATGATLIAALQVVRAQSPREIIVAVPVTSLEGLEEVRRLCDKIVCLSCPPVFWSVGQWYEDFPAVDDDQVKLLLRACGAVACPSEPSI